MHHKKLLIVAIRKTIGNVVSVIQIHYTLFLKNKFTLELTELSFLVYSGLINCIKLRTRFAL